MTLACSSRAQRSRNENSNSVTRANVTVNNELPECRRGGEKMRSKEGRREKRGVPLRGVRKGGEEKKGKEDKEEEEKEGARP